MKYDTIDVHAIAVPMLQSLALGEGDTSWSSLVRVVATDVPNPGNPTTQVRRGGPMPLVAYLYELLAPMRLMPALQPFAQRHLFIEVLT